MSWWKRFNDWVDKSIDKATESPLKDWEASSFGFHGPVLTATKEDAGAAIFQPSVQPTPAECSGAQAALEDSAPAAIPSISDPSRSDEGSDGKSDNGDETPEITLKHASSLPGATFRVFPDATNHRNSYDTEASVRRAVAARKSRPRYGGPTKVYRAETIWRDVTGEYVS